MVFLSLGWQEIKNLSEEQVLVLCSALKWRVAIVAKRRAPMAKPTRMWPLGTIRIPWTHNGWVGIGPLSKKLAVKVFSTKIISVALPGSYIFSPFRTKNSTTVPNLVSLLYRLSWKRRILRYCDLDWHSNPWLMQGNVPKQSSPEKEKGKKDISWTAIAFTKVFARVFKIVAGFFFNKCNCQSNLKASS